jgi:hypothetical protein
VEFYLVLFCLLSLDAKELLHMGLLSLGSPARPSHPSSQPTLETATGEF